VDEQGLEGNEVRRPKTADDWFDTLMVLFIGACVVSLIGLAIWMFTTDDPTCPPGQELEQVAIVPVGKVSTPIYDCK
jgi:hypothetical protein